MDEVDKLITKTTAVQIIFEYSMFIFLLLRSNGSDGPFETNDLQRKREYPSYCRRADTCRTYILKNAIGNRLNCSSVIYMLFHPL